MKKSKVLLFITALVAVVMSASTASAVQYAYVSSDSASIGTIEVATDGKLTQNTASKSFDMIGVSLYSVGENVLATGYSGADTRFVLLDKSLTAVNSFDVSYSLSVTDAAMFNDKLIISEMGRGMLIAVDPTATAIDITKLASIDILGSMAVSGNTLYAAGYRNGTNQVAKITSFPTIADSADITPANTYIYGLTVANGTIYAGGSVSNASSHTPSIYKLDTSTLKFTPVISSDSSAICSDGDTGLYISMSNGKIYHWNGTGTTSTDVTSGDITVYGDIDYDATNKTLSMIINDSLSKFATYKLTDGKFALVDSKDVYAVAKFEETADDESKQETKTSTGTGTAVASEDISADIYAKIKTVTGGNDTVSADSAAYAGTNTAIINAISKDVSGSKVNNLITVCNVTPKSAGWVIVSADLKASYKANLLKGFFVKKGSAGSAAYGASLASLAATGDVVEAKLADANGNELSGSGSVSSAYVLGSLEANTDYAVVVAEGTENSGSSSSGGGCNAGIELTALAVLAFAFFKKH